ncbi:MAG: PFL family protein [Candidatus Odinarchaeia archaeon]
MLIPEEIIETIQMITAQKLNIRTITLGVSLRDCASNDVETMAEKIYSKIVSYGNQFSTAVEKLEEAYGVPIVNKRIAVSPVSLLLDALVDTDELPLEKALTVAESLDNAAKDVGVDYLGGFSSFVQKGFSKGDKLLVESLPEVLSKTERVCSFVNVAETDTGINMSAVYKMGKVIKEIAQKTADKNGIGCAKFTVICNAAEGNPFMPGAFHSVGSGEASIYIGISGPGVIKSVLEKMGDKTSLGDLVEAIKNTSFKVTRTGELIGHKIAELLNIEFGGVDISLAPSPERGNSVGEIIEVMGLEKFGCPGSVAALAMLADALKKGGSMASKYVTGLSGVFIPVQEDIAIAEAAGAGALTIDHLKAMSAVCATGLDMIPLPGDTSDETISAIIADIIAIGVINRKTLGARLIPVPGKKPGEWIDFGGLLGAAPIMPVSKFSPKKFIRRGGEIPAPIVSLSHS